MDGDPLIHSKNHTYLEFLCRTNGITFEELYFNHRELLSIHLSRELFFILKADGVIGDNKKRVPIQHKNQ